MEYKEAIKVLKDNYPPENYTILRGAIDMSIKLLEEKDEMILKQEKKESYISNDMRYLQSQTDRSNRNHYHGY